MLIWGSSSLLCICTCLWIIRRTRYTVKDTFCEAISVAHYLTILIMLYSNLRVWPIRYITTRRVDLLRFHRTIAHTHKHTHSYTQSAAILYMPQISPPILPHYKTTIILYTRACMYIYTRKYIYIQSQKGWHN